MMRQGDPRAQPIGPLRGLMMAPMKAKIGEGSRFGPSSMLPPALTPCLQSAVNFAVFSASATAVSLCLFTEEDLRQGRLTHEIQLNPEINRTGDIWHVMVPRIQPGMLYGERDGPAVQRDGGDARLPGCREP